MTGERHIQVGRDYRETHVKDQAIYVEGNYYNNSEKKQSLGEAAAEIQQLLEQLDKAHSTDTTKGKMAVATQVIESIESKSALSNRALSALKAGSLNALEQLLNHPAASFVVGALEDWQQNKNS